MADNHNQRPYRSNDPYGRGGAPRPATGGDPLAELARLIGQNDPFAEFGRDDAPRAPARDPRQAPRDPTMDWAAPAAHAQHPSAPPPGSYPPAMPDGQPFGGQGYEHQRHGEARYDGGVEAYHTGYEGQGYAPAPHDGQGRQPDQYYHDNHAHAAAENENMYDDMPRPRRRGLLVAATVIALAVIGTAGAFGYRAIFGPSGSTPPPVIKADTAPSKVVPSGEPQSNKLIQDRVGDRGRGERVVSREEQPVDMKDSKPPRVVFPGLGGASNEQPSAAALPGGSGAAGSTEPKKIRTVTIRPDQPVLANPVSSSAASTRPAASRAASAPLATMDSGNAAPLAASPRTAATRSPPPAASANAPLSLNPDGAPSAPAAPPIRNAAAAPRVAAPPVRAATASAASTVPAAANGSYAVQISSQRSETEAQASFQSLQAKYPNVLGGRQSIIRRADLGDKGTYYRAMVGPFATSDQANELCSSLKAAGGQCIVQRN